MPRPFKPKKREDGTRPDVVVKPPKAVFSRPTSTPFTVQQVAAQVLAIRNKNHMPAVNMAVSRWFSTGNFMLDLSVNRGLPGGKIVELSGPESCGKTTLSLAIVAAAQAAGGRGDYFDLEVAMTPGIAEDLSGVDTHPDCWELWRPDNAEIAFDAIDELIPIVGNAGVPAVIVVDSIPAIVPRCEFETPYGEDPRLAGTSRLLARFCRKNLTKLDRFPDVLLIFINHVNTPFASKPFERPERTTPGGKAVKYYTSVRINFTKGGGIDVLERPGTGAKTVARERMRAEVWKNRVGGPGRIVTLPLNFVRETATASIKGFDDARTILEFLRDEQALVNVKSKDGKATGNWALVGLENTNRSWKNWILAYNTNAAITKLLQEVATKTAQTKWTPEEGDDDGVFEDTTTVDDIDSAMRALSEPIG